jgi:hypothetical protein
MAFYSFLTDRFKPRPDKRKHTEDNSRQMSVKQMMEELGVRTSATIGSYEDEERPDKLTIENYLTMQDNDGTVRAITRLFSLPIESAPIKVLPSENDKGERDFIEAVFLGPQNQGGMSTPLPFIIADMTRAIFEGFRFYEKVPQIIKVGPHKGLIGWKKLAPRDASTVKLRSDKNGGFLGAHQTATFGSNSVDVDIPAEKSMLFTFQRERHPLYGESILKTAWYHYDKKHKLYYLAHKKAEIDAVGLKILKLGKPFSETEVAKAEEAVESIGVNSRVTLPTGFELEVDRAPSGYDVLKLIEHHDTQIALSTLTQATQLGTKSTYNYTYGSGFNVQSNFIVQMLQSVMKNMEDTLNEWAVAPLIDWNFKNGSYPKIKLMPLKTDTERLILSIFETIVKKDPSYLTSSFINKLSNEAAEILGLEIKEEEDKDALKAFESGKRKEYDKQKKPAKSTTDEVKDKVKIKAIELKDDPYFLEKFEAMGRDYAIEEINKKLKK